MFQNIPPALQLRFGFQVNKKKIKKVWENRPKTFHFRLQPHNSRSCTTTTTTEKNHMNTKVKRMLLLCFNGMEEYREKQNINFQPPKFACRFLSLRLHSRHSVVCFEMLFLMNFMVNLMTWQTRKNKIAVLYLCVFKVANWYDDMTIEINGTENWETYSFFR